MSVIVWDGKIVAADRQMTSGDLKRTYTKLHHVATDPVRREWSREFVVAGVGSADELLALVDWARKGFVRSEWPDFMRKKDCETKMIVVSASGVALHFEGEPYGIPVKDSFIAWGSGRELSMGAMAMGASATQAVRVACHHSPFCGMGIDAYELRGGAWHRMEVEL